MARCSGLMSTVVCTPEPGVAATTFTAGWTDSLNGRVVFTGRGGALVERGVATAWATFDAGTDDLLAVTGYADGPSTVAIAVGANGTNRTTLGSGLFPYTFEGGTLVAALAFDSTNVFAASADGALWYAPTSLPNAVAPLRSFGGRSPIHDTLTSITGVGGGVLFAVGERGARYRRTNGSWLADGTGFSLGARLNAVTAVSAGEVYAVSDDGQVLVRRYGAWSLDGHLPATSLQAVVADKRRVAAVGAGGAWLEKQRGGPWQSLPAGTRTLYALTQRLDASGAALETIAVGADCAVLTWPVGGDLVEVPVPQCPPGTALRAAAFNSQGDLFVAGEGALVLRRTATGFTREFLDASSLETVRALAAQGTTVWAALERGHLYRRTTTWAAFGGDLTEADLLGAWYDRDEGLFVVGSEGLVWKKP
jgi:hypothetical protein